jgi:hypothetical protein
MRALERRVEFALHLLDKVAAAVARLRHGFAQDGVAPWTQIAECQLLQLAIGEIQPEAVCDRRVDLQRLRGNARPLLARHIVERAHVVGAIRQLDEDDADIARHRQQHFAERLGLVFFAGVELKLVEFGEAVHQFGDRRAELLDELRLGDAAILDRIVQQRGHQGLCIELPLGAL